MKKLQRIAIYVIIAALLLGLAVAQATHSAGASPQPSATSFHFVFSADSRDNYTVLPAFSHKMVTLHPVFGFFGGDLCGSFSVTCINNTWKPALDGNNNDGMLAKTFVMRGNHDNGTLSTWQGLWDFQSMAAHVGATHFTALTSDATYSFDYGNSHFAVVDLPGGGSNTWTSSEISWLDSDLTAAEGHGVAHEFLFAHGPMYGVTSEHGSEQPSSALKAVLNRHPISAGFHGHEHVSQYTHVTPSVESGINDYQEITMGRAGAPPYTVSKPVDWHVDQNAFADVAVNGNDFTVTVYSQSGSSLFTKTFTDGSPAATATSAAPTNTPAATATAAASTNTPQLTATPAATRTPVVTPTVGARNSSATYRSSASYDGQILETSEASGRGGAHTSTGTAFNVGDNVSNRQYRAVLSFNTAGLPDNAVITSVTLKIKKAGQVGSNPYGSMGHIMADIIKGSFSGSAVLQARDFQAASSRNSAISIPNSPVNGWYTKSMNSNYFVYINKTGVTQFRLRFARDDNNNHIADYLRFYSGNAATASVSPGARYQVHGALSPVPLHFRHRR